MKRGDSFFFLVAYSSIFSMRGSFNEGTLTIEFIDVARELFYKEFPDVAFLILHLGFGKTDPSGTIHK